MENYLVSYDLDQPGPQNYERLEKRLRDLGAVRVLYSQWVLKFAGPITSLEQDFLNYVNPATDAFLVVLIVRGGTVWNHLRIEDSEFRGWLAT